MQGRDSRLCFRTIPAHALILDFVSMLLDLDEPVVELDVMGDGGVDGDGESNSIFFCFNIEDLVGGIGDGGQIY